MSSEFAYPRDVRFTCTRCGDCCRGWHVMLGPGEKERLGALSWEGIEPDLAGVVPAAPVPGDATRGRLALARRDDGACIYLGPENQCRIHERFGEAAKPLLCRLYPFGFFPVADRVAVEVSFACRAVSQDRGAPLAERLPEWARLLEGEGAGEPQAQGRHHFSKKYDVSGELLWELEHHLLDLLSEASLSLPERVRAVLEFNRLATTSDPRTPQARLLRQLMAKELPRQVREGSLPPQSERMDKTGRAVFFHLLFVMLNPTPPELLALPAKSRDREARARVQAADGYKFQSAHPLLDNRTVKVTFGDVDAVSAGYLVRGEGASLAARYLTAKVVGQRFLREGDVELPFLEAVPRLLLLYPILAWASKVLAAERGAAAVADRDARGALRLVDRSFGEVRLSLLPAKARKAWSFVLNETDLPLAATREMVGAAPKGDAL